MKRTSCVRQNISLMKGVLFSAVRASRIFHFSNLWEIVHKIWMDRDAKICLNGTNYKYAEAITTR